MPEEAPVMRTTFPAIFSAKKERKKEKKYLKTAYGGKKNKRVRKVDGGATKFKNPFINSMAFLLICNTKYKQLEQFQLIHTRSVCDYYIHLCTHGLISMQYEEMISSGTWHAIYATRMHVIVVLRLPIFLLIVPDFCVFPYLESI